MKKYVLSLIMSLIFVSTFSAITLAANPNIPVSQTANRGHVLSTKIQSGVMGADWVSDTTWQLHTGTGDRIYERFVPFETPFQTIPKVVLSLVSVDTGVTATTRVRVEPTNITLQGFYVRVGTWMDSIVYAVGVSWIAYN